MNGHANHEQGGPYNARNLKLPNRAIQNEPIKTSNTSFNESKSHATAKVSSNHFFPNGAGLNGGSTENAVNGLSHQQVNGIEREQSSESLDRETKSEQYRERVRKAIEASAENNRDGSRPSSAQAMQSQKNLRARYWSYLFENLHRAVDEIYSTCDHDESVIECQVIRLD